MSHRLETIDQGQECWRDNGPMKKKELRINGGNYSDFHLCRELKLVLWAAKLRLFMRNYRFLDVVFVQDHCSQSCSCIIMCSESAIMPKSTCDILSSTVLESVWGVYQIFLSISEPDSIPHYVYSIFWKKWISKQQKKRKAEMDFVKCFKSHSLCWVFLHQEESCCALAGALAGLGTFTSPGGEGQKCPRPLVFGHHEDHKLTQVCRFLRPIMLTDKLCHLLKTHCSGKKMDLTLEDSLLWEEDAADPCHGRFQPHLHQRGQGYRGYCCCASLCHRDHSSGYRTCW